jgi:hypothetical protein
MDKPTCDRNHASKSVRRSALTVVEDVTFTNNIVRHAAGVFDILGYDDIFPTQQTKRILIKDNLFDDINGPNWEEDSGNSRFCSTGSQRHYRSQFLFPERTRYLQRGPRSSRVRLHEQYYAS